MALKVFQEQVRYKGWVGTEKLTLLYTTFTTLLLLVFWKKLADPQGQLLLRMAVLSGIFLAVTIYRWRPSRATLFLRQFWPLTLLSVWYPDTYEFCCLFPYQDHIFAAADAYFFGMQPSLVFNEVLSGKFWSELFHMGYFSYYPLILLTVVASIFTKPSQFSRTSFIVLGSFFLYYVIYLFTPVAGPQYYFCATGLDCILQGIYPEMGTYFRHCTEMLPSPGPHGFFHDLIVMTQASGERPTAAFPSSHVGISTILMFLLYRDNRRLLWIALPFYIFLCCATVYIQAHYLVDVFGGFLSAIVIYTLTSRLYPWMTRTSPEFQLAVALP